MKKWDDLVEETMTPEAIARSNACAEAMIAQIHKEAKEAAIKNINSTRHIDHEKHVAVSV